MLLLLRLRKCLSPLAVDDASLLGAMMGSSFAASKRLPASNGWDLVRGWTHAGLLTRR